MEEIQNFEVSVKAFMMNGEKLLLVKEAESNLWELPGGRIRASQKDLPVPEILAEKIKKELGPNVKFEQGHVVATWTRPFESGECTFLIGFMCDYLEGDITLSSEHSEYAWVDEENSKILEYVPNFQWVLEDFWAHKQG